MNHHTDQIPCPLCAEKLEQAHPELRRIFPMIKQAFPDCHISWAFRNEEDQNRLFDEHKTRARFPHSKHNYELNGLPWARALDLFKMDDDGVAWFPPKMYFEISQFLTQNGLPVEWAGSWVHFPETDHFQLLDSVV